MAILKLTQVIDRPVADVFRVVCDGGHFASWNPTIRRSRQLTTGDIGDGTRFEWQLRGFGKVEQEVRDFDPNRRVRIVPDTKSIAGGHRFTFTDLGTQTRVDHELEMTPKGAFKILSPVMTMVGRRNLRATAAALARHVERRDPG
jgi:uncharacterized protein YndB with AHSA1/START domain